MKTLALVTLALCAAAAQAEAECTRKLMAFYKQYNRSKSAKDVSDTITYYLTNGGDPNAPGDGPTQLNAVLLKAYGSDLSKMDGGDSLVTSLRKLSTPTGDPFAKPAPAKKTPPPAPAAARQQAKAAKGAAAAAPPPAAAAQPAPAQGSSGCGSGGSVGARG